MTDSQATPTSGSDKKETVATDKVRPPQVSLPETSEKKEAEKFGEVGKDGTVYVNDDGTKRAIGQFPDGLPEHPFDLYIRRFLDLKSQLELFETRLHNLSAREVDSTLKALEEQLEEPAAIGDLVALRKRLEVMKGRAEEHKEELKERRQQAKAESLAERERIVAEAESIAHQDPHRTQWKESGKRLRALLEEWKTSQRQGVRIDRPTEDALWKRFSQARTAFDRSRRQFFHELDVKQAETKAKKEDIIARAEELSSSTDWGATTIAFRRLMDEWKAAGRASRKDDDALWERFWQAQNVFFEARNASNAAVAEEQQENLKLKEAIVEKAEAILPITDIDAAKSILRPLQDEWDTIGHVPRAEINRIEGRMRAVEQAIADAEEAEWRQSNPETKARAEGMAGQLEELIEQLSAELEKAKKDKDAKKVKELEESLKARQAWLEQVRSVTD